MIDKQNVLPVENGKVRHQVFSWSGGLLEAEQLSARIDPGQSVRQVRVLQRVVWRDRCQFAAYLCAHVGSNV